MRTLCARRLTGSATVVALVMHLLAGCCAHHAHAACAACESQRENTASAKQWHTSAEPCHTDHAPAGPKHQHRCDAGRCVFVSSGEENGAKVGAVPLAASSPAVLPPAAAGDRSGEFAPVWNHTGWGGVRFHLLKRVLLV